MAEGPPGFAVLPPDARAAEIARAFTAVHAAQDDDAYDAALDELALMVSLDGQAHARELAASSDVAPEPFWQRQFLRSFEVLDDQRKMGRFSDKDELYRIAAVNHRLALFAGARLASAVPGDGVLADIRRFHDEQLFDLSPRTPDGTLLPPVPSLTPDPPMTDARALAGGIRRVAAVDRVREAIEGWEGLLDERDEHARAELDAAMTIARKEHRKALSLAAWATDAGLMTEQERATMEAALTPFDKASGGWPSGTSTATKVAVSEAIAGLHDLHAARGR